MAPMSPVPPLNSMQFATAAGALTRASGALGLTGPGFRCPPRLPGVDRSLRRRADGSVIVAVRVRGRLPSAVLADMIEGVLASNRIGETTATSIRSALWEAVSGIGPALEVRSEAEVLYRSPAARVA